jgi:hypothetical protein
MHKDRPSSWRFLAENVSAFWPLLATPVIMFLAFHFRLPWLGMIAFVVLGLAIRYWWTCVFGLLNAMALLGGFLGCVVATIKMFTK